MTILLFDHACLATGDRICYLWWRVLACYVSDRDISSCCFYYLQRRYWTRSGGHKWAQGDVRGNICQNDGKETGLAEFAGLCVHDEYHGGLIMDPHYNILHLL
jgi:hypothetical protein